MYPSDLSDKQWAKLEPLLCQRTTGKHAGGRPRLYPLRRVVDAVLYVVKTGCQWRQLPKDSPPWKSVYEEFMRWRRTGLWARISRALRKELRQKLGRSAQPTVAIIDSQSVKRTLKGDGRGYDAGKKIKGRKRHIAVDTQGLLRAVGVHSAGIQDRVGAPVLLLQLAALCCTIRTIFADSAYTSTLVEWVRALFDWTLTIVKRTEAHRFVVFPKC